jgi:hypothetical protein
MNERDFLFWLTGYLNNKWKLDKEDVEIITSNALEAIRKSNAK